MDFFVAVQLPREVALPFSVFEFRGFFFRRVTCSVGHFAGEHLLDNENLLREWHDFHWKPRSFSFLVSENPAERD